MKNGSDGGDTSIARFHYLSDMLTDFKNPVGRPVIGYP